MTDNLYEQLSVERKQGQIDGTIPDWFTTSGYQMFKQKEHDNLPCYANNQRR